MKDLLEIAIFTRVAERKNFSSVAQELGLAPSAVSRQISRLEQNLGVQLLLRSTRQLRLTDAGQLLYQKSISGLREIEAARSAINQIGSEPKGWLRVLSTPCFGKFHIVPAIPDYIDRFPKVSVDVSLGYLTDSFIESGFDILVRASSLGGAGISIDVLTPVTQIVCASPGYLKKNAPIKTYHDLANQNCLIASRPKPKLEWRFQVSGKIRRVRVRGNYHANSVEALYNAALSDLGVAVLPNYVAARALQSGLLIPLFPANADSRTRPVGPSSIKAFSARARQPNMNVISFTSFLRERFGNQYDWEAKSGGLHTIGPTSRRRI